MMVPLPSGVVIELEPPTVRGIMACDGTIPGIVDAVWASGEIASGALTTADARAVATWAVQTLREDGEVFDLALACATFGELPSGRLGIADRALAFDLDAALAAALHPPKGPQ